MKVTIDNDGYVTGWALVGDNGGIDVDNPDDLDGFLECFSGYKLVDGVLTKDEERDTVARLEQVKDELRRRRKEECYAYVNRGQLWYGLLTVRQLAELTSWYKAWRDITETLEVPERPSWLEDD